VVVEGEVFLGGIAAAWVGFYVKGLPAFRTHSAVLCRRDGGGGGVGDHPGGAEAYYNVSEICVTILMNYVRCTSPPISSPGP
jgi:simple sugar transport system permease protein